jgi:TetR/AcrR family transcriptional regulator, regulator of cefoperazone and chloramphenicol sensitivity
MLETNPSPIDRGERARTRLLSESSRIFAEKGYAKASTREICEAAGLNTAAIHYHFGDKAGLYGAVLLGPIRAMAGQLAGFDAPGLTLTQSLERLLGPFVGADGQEAPEVDDGMRLWMREMVEPTPVFAQTAAQTIGPLHQSMARLFARHIGMAEPDEDVHRLVFGLIAMAHDYCLSREFMKAVSPGLLEGPKPLQRARERLIDWGLALVAHERSRRGLPQKENE